MPLPPALQSSRFEMKYLITEGCARAIRDFALSYLEPDEHDNPAEGFEYAVHSLYLDSPSLALCRATMQGQKNRFKLRIRYYDDLADSPAYLEVKRRLNDVIFKQRCAVRKSGIARILAGHWPAPGDVLDDTPRGRAALQQFLDLRTRIHAEGMVFVAYKREAYITPNSNAVRLTFDRRLHGALYDGSGMLHYNGDRVFPEVGGVVLELKFTDRFPVWMQHMACVFGLERRSVAKYVACACALRIPGLRL